MTVKTEGAHKSSKQRVKRINGADTVTGLEKDKK